MEIIQFNGLETLPAAHSVDFDPVFAGALDKTEVPQGIGDEGLAHGRNDDFVDQYSVQRTYHKGINAASAQEIVLESLVGNAPG